MKTIGVVLAGIRALGSKVFVVLMVLAGTASVCLVERSQNWGLGCT
jgi:hypothetical protein